MQLNMKKITNYTKSQNTYCENRDIYIFDDLIYVAPCGDVYDDDIVYYQEFITGDEIKMRDFAINLGDDFEITDKIYKLTATWNDALKNKWKKEEYNVENHCMFIVSKNIINQISTLHFKMMKILNVIKNTPPSGFFADWQKMDLIGTLISNLDFLCGFTKMTPYHCAPLDNDHNLDINSLVFLHEIGIMTTNGQSGLQYAPPYIHRQREYLDICVLPHLVDKIYSLEKKNLIVSTEKNNPRSDKFDNRLVVTQTILTKNKCSKLCNYTFCSHDTEMLSYFSDCVKTMIPVSIICPEWNKKVHIEKILAELYKDEKKLFLYYRTIK